MPLSFSNKVAHVLMYCWVFGDTNGTFFMSARDIIRLLNSRGTKEAHVDNFVDEAITKTGILSDIRDQAYRLLGKRSMLDTGLYYTFLFLRRMTHICLELVPVLRGSTPYHELMQWISIACQRQLCTGSDDDRAINFGLLLLAYVPCSYDYVSNCTHHNA